MAENTKTYHQAATGKLHAREDCASQRIHTTPVELTAERFNSEVELYDAACKKCGPTAP
jgi:hypothetical protein